MKFALLTTGVIIAVSTNTKLDSSKAVVHGLNLNSPHLSTVNVKKQEVKDWNVSKEAARTYFGQRYDVAFYEPAIPTKNMSLKATKLKKEKLCKEFGIVFESDEVTVPAGEGVGIVMA